MWVGNIKAALQVLGSSDSNMPLEQFPNHFDDATHHELDRAVDKAASNWPSGLLLSPLQYCALLTRIVKYSKGDLDPKYIDVDDAGALINTYGELQDMLSSAWEQRAYREIRNLGACPPSMSITYQHLVHRSASHSQSTETRPGTISRDTHNIYARS